MEVSDVRKRVFEMMDRAKKAAIARRAGADQAASEYQLFLDRIAIPLFRQIANILKAEKYPFTVFTPSGGVRLMSDRSADDFVEITLDTSDDAPRAIARISRSRGRRAVDAERTIAGGDPAVIGDEELLAFMTEVLEPFVEK